MLSKDVVQRFGLPNMLFFGQVFVFQFFFMFLPIHLQNIGLGNWQIGFLMGLLPITAMLLSVPFGVFADRIVPKQMVIAALLLTACFVFALGYAESFALLILLFLLGGTARNLFYVGLYALYYKTMGGRDINRKIAIVEISRVGGYGLGPFVAGMLLVGAGFALLFNLAFLAVIPLVLLGLFLKKTRGINFDISEYKKDLKNKKFLLIFAGYFFLALHFGAEDTSHALFLQKTVGLDFQQMGLVFLWIMAVIMAFTLVATKALDSGKKTRAVLLAGLVASGIGNIMYLWAFSMPMVLFSRLVHEAGDAFAILSIKAVVPDLTRMKRVGGVFGTLTFASYTGSMAGSFVSGVSADIWGYAMPFALTGGALFVTALIFALLFFGGGKVIKGKKQ